MNWAALEGQMCSSTRAELAAACVALLANMPIHIASDSKSMVEKAGKIIQFAKLASYTMSAKGSIPRNIFGRPWGMQTDGDLWELVWEAVTLRRAQHC